MSVSVCSFVLVGMVNWKELFVIARNFFNSAGFLESFGSVFHCFLLLLPRFPPPPGFSKFIF